MQQQLEKAKPTSMARVRGHTVQEKAKARKSGPSAKQKTLELGEKANVIAFMGYWDPTHLCFRAAVHLPEGETLPDVNRLVSLTVSTAPTISRLMWTIVGGYLGWKQEAVASTQPCAPSVSPTRRSRRRAKNFEAQC